eukprot:8861582-Lingulodinium_polyedra.AAC.1
MKCTAGEARRRWGRRLVVAALGAVEKNPDKDEWRVVYDATNGVRLNHRIRVRDQVRCPTWPDVCRLLEAVREDGRAVHFGITFDVAKAHRRIPIREADWGFLACRAEAGRGEPAEEEELYINRVGTFGVASAAYWWARLGALILRLLYAVLGPDFPVYAWLYSDDGALIGAGPKFAVTIGIAFLFLAVLGVPLSWRKVRGGTSLEWVGFVVDVREFRLGVTARRRAWAASWCEGMADSSHVYVRELREGLGRL